MTEDKLIEMYGMVKETRADIHSLITRYNILEEEHRGRVGERDCVLDKHEQVYHRTSNQRGRNTLEILGRVAQWAGIGTAIVIAVFKR